MTTLSSLRRTLEAQQGTSGVDSADVLAIAGSGVSVYEALDSLPSTGLTAGDEAYVKSNSRLYISNGSGWYNVSLVNSAPYWDSEPLTSYDITDSSTALVITAKALDSDNPAAIITNQSFASDSAQYLVNITRDSSVFTFTPKTQDSVWASATAGDLTDSNTNDFIYTFKWTDGVSFVSKAVTINYNFSTDLSADGHYIVTQSNWGSTWNALTPTTVYAAGTISNTAASYTWTIQSITSNFYSPAWSFDKNNSPLSSGAWFKFRTSNLPTSFAGRTGLYLEWQDGLDNGWEYGHYHTSYNPDNTTNPHGWHIGFSDRAGLNTGTLSGWDDAFFYNPSDGYFVRFISTNSGSTWSRTVGGTAGKYIPASSRAASDYFFMMFHARSGSGQAVQLLDGEDLSASDSYWPY